MLEHLYSAETWKTIEAVSKVLAIVLTGAAALNGALALTANKNAQLRSNEPRSVTAMTDPVAPKANQPLSVVIVAHGSPEAQSYADQLSAALPADSKVTRFNIGFAPQMQAPEKGVLYNPNGNDPQPVISWLEAHGITTEATTTFPIPASQMMEVRDRVILIVGPKK